jgi:hypothetical protein
MRPLIPEDKAMVEAEMREARDKQSEWDRREKQMVAETRREVALENATKLVAAKIKAGHTDVWTTFEPTADLIRRYAREFEHYIKEG